MCGSSSLATFTIGGSHRNGDRSRHGADFDQILSARNYKLQKSSFARKLSVLSLLKIVVIEEEGKPDSSESLLRDCMRETALFRYPLVCV